MTNNNNLLGNAQEKLRHKMLENKQKIDELLKKKEDTDDDGEKSNFQKSANKMDKELRGSKDILNTMSTMKKCALGFLGFMVLKSIFGGDTYNNYYSYPPMMTGTHMSSYGDGEHYNGTFDIDAMNQQAQDLGITQDGELLIDQATQEQLTEIGGADTLEPEQLQEICQKMDIEPEQLVQEYDNTQSLSI